MKLSEWLDQNRYRRRQHFAAEIGTSGAHLSRIESGLSEASPPLARRIVAATGGAVTLDDLYGLSRGAA